MVSVMSECECPNCGYERAMRDYYCNSMSEYIHCYQCGYNSELSVNKEKSVYPDDLVWNDIEEGGSGSYHYRKKGHTWCRIGPILEDTVDILTKNLDNYDMCKYTFKKDEHWYVKDMVHNTETIFTYEDLLNEEWEKEGIWCYEI